MNVIVRPSRLCGEIAAIPSKSQAHRMLICAALASEPTLIRCQSAGQDMDATARCLRALGAEIGCDEEGYHVSPIGTPVQHAELDVGESGSTLRFLLPVVCALGVNATFLLHGRLAQRPLEPLWSELQRNGARLSRDESTIEVSGCLTGRDYTLAANVSSQFLSGILMALPILGGGSLTMTGKLESESYLNMTVEALQRFGSNIKREDTTFYVPNGPLKSPESCAVEGDWSNSAFWLCAEAIGGQSIKVTGLDPASPQGDRAVVEVIAAIRKGNAVIDCTQIPDLVPPLAVLAALTPGNIRFAGAARLRLKESDRITACVQLLRSLGGEAEELPDGFTVEGKRRLQGGIVDSFGDHRIAMAAAIAAAGCEGEIEILNPQAVEKSYAAFWQDYCRLGGSIAWKEVT